MKSIDTQNSLSTSGEELLPLDALISNLKDLDSLGKKDTALRLAEESISKSAINPELISIYYKLGHETGKIQNITRNIQNLCTTKPKVVPLSVRIACIRDLKDSGNIDDALQLAEFSLKTLFNSRKFLYAYLALLLNQYHNLRLHELLTVHTY